MDAQSLPNNYKPVIATEACSPDFICGIHEVSKRIRRLNKTGDNFSVWERHLKAMICTLTGTSEYFLRELHTLDPKFNRAIFHLIFWSIDEDLQHVLNIDGSAGDAFQALADRFRLNTSARCIMSRVDFPEEILDNIVSIVYYKFSGDKNDIRHRKEERIKQQDQGRQVYVNHGCPPILNTFQNLAVVNRKFHRLCLPKLWQHIRFPSALPAPVSLWTEDILSRHGHLVKSLELGLEDLTNIENEELSTLERSHQDNTSAGRSYFVDMSRQGIGVRSIKKIFRACPCLASVAIDIPDYSDEPDLFGSIISGLKWSFGLVPQLQHLTLRDSECAKLPGVFVIDIHNHIPSLVSLEIIDFKFGPTASTEKSLGWKLAQHRNLRKLRLENVTCEDQTWTLNSWPQRLTTLDLEYCPGLTPGMVQKLLSGSAPFLTTLQITLMDWEDDSDVNASDSS
ncbi:uncharacterized protein MELLADRAFT_91153 [Melampsora larici-populina 98AG31]|uniref:Uncharacterized protein n=1 Tax=Melampsora larici-populina (strain 98AG31 / pathotype 3-4-7) TaxID=747676 RepID=F4RY04_MELLP|nr:uncharacterized protein MELLADRAFT_91153 [Melampsora larici-populina 98AG31]EGG02727.1 hypothetical protein MELLADRAFT_91153 [Melampsora larici-populina 98AG31]